MKQIIFILILAMASSTLAITSTCYYNVGGNIRSLGSIAHFFFDVSGTNFDLFPTNYRFQVCAGQSPCQNTDGIDSAACQNVNSTAHYNLGNLATQTITGGSSTNYQVNITYTGGDSADCGVAGARKTTVQVMCGTDVKIVSATEPSRCSYLFIIESPDACAPLNTTICEHNGVDLSGLSISTLFQATGDFYDPKIRSYYVAICKPNPECIAIVNASVAICQTNPDHDNVTIIIGQTSPQVFGTDFQGSYVKYSGGDSVWCVPTINRSLRINLSCDRNFIIVPYTTFYFESAQCGYYMTVSSPVNCPLVAPTTVITVNI
eukprot:gene12363-14503_t